MSSDTPPTPWRCSTRPGWIAPGCRALAGGYLALRVATRFPERVSGVLAIGTLGAVGDGGAGQLGPNILSRLDEATRAELAELEAREEAGTATEEDALRGFALAWPGYFADPANAPACPRDIRLSEAGHLETVASIERDAERVASAVARCAVPVVFLHGSADPIDLEGSARATAAVMPRAKVIVLPGVGHFGVAGAARVGSRRVRSAP